MIDLSSNMKHIIFVYGTLKTGLHNHHLMTTGSKGHCCYLGTAVTSGKFPLIVATRFNIPFLLFAPDHGYVSSENCFIKINNLCAVLRIV